MTASPIKTVIVTSEIVGPYRNGGIGTFVTNFAYLLRNHGYDVSIVYLNRLIDKQPEEWEYLYSFYGIDVIMAHGPAGPNLKREQRMGAAKRWFMVDNRALADLIPADTDIIYFQELMGTGFTFHRRRRYQSDSSYPIAVTVTHGSQPWVREAMGRLPRERVDLELDFMERYATAAADYLVSPSRYMINWLLDQGWELPTPERRRVLGLPFAHNPAAGVPLVQPAEAFKRIVFFGRLEVRKGFELFIDALVRLKNARPDCMQSLEEIVFLGRNGGHRFVDERAAAEYLETRIGIPARMITTFDTYQANQYLIDHRADSLAVIPSLVDNFPNTVIEASLIRGLNLLLAASGGIPEIVGSAGKESFFAPNVNSLMAALEKWLRMGPQPEEKLPDPYNIPAHNRGWLDFHRELCDLAAASRAQRAHPSPRSLHLPQLDVCIVCNDAGAETLPFVLQGLAVQTNQNFSATIVNDAADSLNAIFKQMRAEYSQHGWNFVQSDDHQGSGESWDIAAHAGESPYILFLDASAIPTPTLIQDLLAAIYRAGDDCLTCYSLAYRDDAFPYVIRYDEDGRYAGFEQTCKVLQYETPPGNCIELGLLANVFGEGCCIARRDVFEALGGFGLQEELYRYNSGGFYEFLAKLIFAGYRLEVYPEYLFYRHILENPPPSTLTHSGTRRFYHAKLREVGLEHLISLIQAIEHENSPV